MAIGDDAFRVFISHKQEDHALAVEVKRAMEGLAPELIDCFVSGVDIVAGSDWRREIRSVLAESHLLVLLFTAPTKNWDWCLYETGLYTRFDLADPRSVVCLSAAGQGSPSPLADLQGVPVDVDRLGAFLDALCRRTWEVSDDWRRGPLAPEIAPDQVEAAARSIVEAFRRSGPSRPTTRAIALSFRFPNPTTWRKEFPRARGWSSGRVTPRLHAFVVRPRGRRRHAYLGRFVGGRGRADADWRRELDSHFLRAVDEQLFPPVEGRMRCAGAEPGSRTALPSDPLQHRARAHDRTRLGIPPGPTSGRAR